MTRRHSEVSRLSIAVDIGGTTIKGALLDSTGHVHARVTVPTFDGGNALDTLHLVIDELRSRAPAGEAPVDAIGICTPGLVQSHSGVVAYAANLEWNDLALATLVSTRHNVPVRVDHDARAAAAAEAVSLGATPGAEDLLFVPIGTGVSSAIISAGWPLSGSTGSAGEIGHIIVHPGGETCPCGQQGCVEAYASATSILNRYRNAGGTASSVPDIVASLHTNQLAAHIWEEAVDALARGIAAATATVDPLIIVIGGGLSQAGSSLTDPLKKRISEILTWRPVPHIQASHLGSHAGLIGAALLSASNQQRATFVRTMHTDLSRRTTPSPVSTH